LGKSKKPDDQVERYQYECEFDAGIRMNPLLHMLLIVDNIQDWGRPKGGKPFFESPHLELVSISEPGKSRDEPLEVELDVREGLQLETKPEVFNKKVFELRTLSVVLGHEGLPVTARLYKGIDNKEPVHKTITLGQ